MQPGDIVWVGLKVIACRVGCSRGVLLQWIDEDGFPAWKKAGVWRALPHQVALWLDEQSRKPHEGHGVRRTGGM